MITINLGDKENPKEVKIGESLPLAKAERITDLLREYQDIFAWSYADMPSLDSSIVDLLCQLIQISHQRSKN